MNSETFQKYNLAWEAGVLQKPLILLIGGYCGTGKSTTASILAKNLGNITILQTGVIRAIYQTIYAQEEVPELFEQSYSLPLLQKYQSFPIEVASRTAFKEQLRIVEEGIKKVIRFAEIDGQQFIIEGNHVSADLAHALQSKTNVISFFLKVSDEQQHRTTMNSTTHRREITDVQMKVARILQDQILEDVNKLSLPVFEYNEIELIIGLLNQRLHYLLVNSLHPSEIDRFKI